MSVPAASPPKRSPFHKYWVILSTRTQEDMAYRSNYVVGVIFRFLPLVTTIFLWYAIFKTRQAAGSPTLIRGLSYEDMVAYYALMYIARGFSSMPGTMRDISVDIKDGLLNRYLTRPMDYLWYQVMYRLAHKVVFWYIALFTFPPCLYLLRHYFTHSPTVWEWAGFRGLAVDRLLDRHALLLHHWIPGFLVPGNFHLSFCGHDHRIFPLGALGSP